MSAQPWRRIQRVRASLGAVKVASRDARWASPPIRAQEIVRGGGGRIPPGGSGRGLLQSGSVAVLLAAAGPDEIEGVAVLDEVGVNRDGEARIVQLDREIVAAFAGALRPGGSDLDA